MAQVPAYRYQIFIDAFEELVGRHQRQIERANSLNRPYDILRNAMEAAKLPNTQYMELDEHGVTASVIARPDDHIDTFDRIADDIGAALIAAGLRRADQGDYSTYYDDYSPRIAYTWVCLPAKHVFNVRLWLRLPKEGIAGCRVSTTTRTFECEQYVYETDEDASELSRPADDDGEVAF